MMVVKKILIGIFIILIGLGLYQLAELYSPGSYPNVEQYSLDLSEKEVIGVISKFKKGNPKFTPLDEFGLKDGRKNETDHWYNIYFYYPETKEILFVWTRPHNSTTTTIGFVSVNKGDELGHWKDINKDFDTSENLLQKKKFSELILDPIREMIRQENSKGQ